MSPKSIENSEILKRTDFGPTISSTVKPSIVPKNVKSEDFYIFLKSNFQAKVILN